MPSGQSAAGRPVSPYSRGWPLPAEITLLATSTSNALTNTAMVAVNDRLGYEIIEYLGDVQERL
jgi:hypothetical protein